MRLSPICERSMLIASMSSPLVSVSAPMLSRFSCQEVVPRSWEKVLRNKGDTILLARAEDTCFNL